MASLLHIDPALFDPAAVPAETLALNKEIVARLEAEPFGLSIPHIRARRIQGLGAFPPSPKLPRAETFAIAGPSGPLELLVLAAERPRAICFHMHRGRGAGGAP